MARPSTRAIRRRPRPCRRLTRAQWCRPSAFPVRRHRRPRPVQPPSFNRACTQPEPVQGWEQWCWDIEDIIAVCESGKFALHLVQAKTQWSAASVVEPRTCRPLPADWRSIREPARGTDEQAPVAGARSKFPLASASMPELRFPIISRRRRGKRRPGTVRRTAVARSHRCSVPGCRRLPIECAHVREGTDGGVGLKPSDRWTISLCMFHRREQHALGERTFEAKYDIDLLELAQEFARRSPLRARPS